MTIKDAKYLITRESERGIWAVDEVSGDEMFIPAGDIKFFKKEGNKLQFNEDGLKRMGSIADHIVSLATKLHLFSISEEGSEEYKKLKEDIQIGVETISQEFGLNPNAVRDMIVSAIDQIMNFRKEELLH